MSVLPKYIHKRNPDGLWDSICLICFMNGASGMRRATEAELNAAEESHICDADIASQQAYRRATQLD
jgi:squalene cyclase